MRNQTSEKLSSWTLSIVIIVAIVSGFLLALANTVNRGHELSQMDSPQPHTIEQAIAQTASKPIGGNLYKVCWQKSSTQYGIAITSHKDVRVGDCVSISSVSSGDTGYFQFVTEWKPSSVTSW